MMSADSRPRLASKTRLRFDRKESRYLLLYPEKGLVLNETAGAIARLCTGEHTVTAIITTLAAQYPTQPREAIEREVHEFLGALADRGLVHDGA